MTLELTLVGSERGSVIEEGKALGCAVREGWAHEILGSPALKSSALGVSGVI